MNSGGSRWTAVHFAHCAEAHKATARSVAITCLIIASRPQWDARFMPFRTLHAAYQCRCLVLLQGCHMSASCLAAGITPLPRQLPPPDIHQQAVQRRSWDGFINLLRRFDQNSGGIGGELDGIVAQQLNSLLELLLQGLRPIKNAPEMRNNRRLGGWVEQTSRAFTTHAAVLEQAGPWLCAAS